MADIDRTQNNNAEIARALREGTEEGFADFYEAFAPRLAIFVTRSLGDAATASDIVHDAMIIVRTHIGQLRSDDNLTAWVYAITRNEMRAHARRRSRTVLTSDVPENPTETDFSGVMEHHDLALLLGASMSGLTNREQRVYQLYAVSGMPVKHIADTLDLTVDNTRKLLQRVRLHVAQSMEALLLTRHGCNDCPEFQHLLVGWDGQLSPLWRKRIARHVEECSGCEQQCESVISMVPMLAVKKVSVGHGSRTLTV